MEEGERAFHSRSRMSGFEFMRTELRAARSERAGLRWRRELGRGWLGWHAVRFVAATSQQATEEKASQHVAGNCSNGAAGRL